MKYEGMVAVSVPPKTQLEARLQQAMLAFLALFFFTLPLVEAPKNLAAVLFLAAWSACAAVTRDLGGRWNRYDTAFATVLASALISGLAGYAGDLGGVFRVLVMAWVLSRSSLGERDFWPLAFAASAGLLIGIPPATWHLLNGTRQFFELNSVGQVNQSALYLAILAAAVFGWWLQLACAGQRGRARTWFALTAIVFWGALLLSASRAAILAAGVAVLLAVVAIAWTWRHPAVRKLLVRAGAAVAVLVVLVAAVTAWSPTLSDRKLTPERIGSTSSMHNRMQHWRIAYEGWKQRPWIGWGPDAFQRLTVDDVCAWRAARGETCDRELYVPTKHAHSLYMATLSERGLLGAFALLVLFATWTWSLVRSATTAANSKYWVASLAGLCVVFIGGVFNTTLRVEHGSLALAYFGLWIAVAGRQRKAQP